MNTALPPGNRERDSRKFSSGVRRRSLACVVLLASVVGVVTLFMQVTDPWIGLRLAARARVVALGAEWAGVEARPAGWPANAPVVLDDQAASGSASTD